MLWFGSYVIISSSSFYSKIFIWWYYFTSFWTSPGLHKAFIWAVFCGLCFDPSWPATGAELVGVCWVTWIYIQRWIWKGVGDLESYYFWCLDMMQNDGQESCFFYRFLSGFFVRHVCRSQTGSVLDRHSQLAFPYCSSQSLKIAIPHGTWKRGWMPYCKTSDLG